MRATLAPGVDAWAVSLKYLMGAVLGAGGVLLAAYKYMQDNIVSKSEEMKSLKKFPAKKKERMSMKESFKFLTSSPYIRDLALLVISYGMCINIVEVSWKAKLKQAFPDPNSYSAFMGNFSSATGTVTLIMMLLGRTIFQKFGWRTAALVTPSVRANVVSWYGFVLRCMLSIGVLTGSFFKCLLNCWFFFTDDWSYRTRLLWPKSFLKLTFPVFYLAWDNSSYASGSTWCSTEHSQQELQILAL